MAPPRLRRIVSEPQPQIKGQFAIEDDEPHSRKTSSDTRYSLQGARNPTRHQASGSLTGLDVHQGFTAPARWHFFYGLLPIVGNDGLAEGDLCHGNGGNSPTQSHQR
jgi:hypothetical protein